MSDRRESEVTRLLEQVADGDEMAVRQLLPTIYDDLHEMAQAYFRKQEAGHSLQPTAIVHEAFVKLVATSSRWQDRAHFYAVAATAMRQILIDHARRKRAEKRGGGERDRVTLGNLVAPSGAGEIDILALDEAMTRLAVLDPRQHRIVELRFFADLQEEEIAAVIGVSRTTVQTEWRLAKAWLATELNKAAAP